MLAFRTLAGFATGVAVLFSQVTAATAQEVGRETGFDIPRFVSMRSSKANVRRGPTLEHKIDWVFERAGLPVVVRAEFGHWRLIEDAQGDGGWVHRALIMGAVTGLVLQDEVNVYSAPTEDADILAKALKDVIFEIDECGSSWCKVVRGDVRGWMLKRDIWGVDIAEVKK